MLIYVQNCRQSTPNNFNNVQQEASVVMVFPLNAGIPYTYRLDGSLFNLRRLKAVTMTSKDTIYELQYQYADDAAIPAHSAEDLQSSLDTLSTAYRRACEYE